MVVKVTYFAMTGLGEPIRLMLAVTKTEFEDIRLNKEQWRKLKPTLKSPHLPMLEMDGRTLFQSLSISRYLARKHGLSGSNEEEDLDIDMTADTLEDMRRNVIVHYYQPDSEERNKGLKKSIEETIPFYLKLFEKQLEENNGYLAAGKLTWADIWFLSHSDYLSSLMGQDLLVNFPKLKKHQEALRGLPGIKEYLAKRPPHPQDHRVFFN
uniref:glutathione transferase n=1 Tax=Eocanthecona furcellata TaxID=696902 RepID=A0AA49X7X5_9HEMI|nr:glutathione S-transferase [Eocanthecona furcellata]